MLMAEMETELVQPRSPIGDVWEAKSEATPGKIARLNSKNPLIGARISGNLCFCLRQL